MERDLCVAVVFGVAAVPWTYAFVVGLHVPLWPSFIASATYYAAGGGLDGLIRGYASNLAGILYAAATLLIVNAALGGGPLALSVVGGVFMLLASLHEFIPLLSFTPAGSSATRPCSASTRPTRRRLASPDWPEKRSRPSSR